MTGSEILDLPMSMNDAGATTVRAYLIALLSEVWQKGEGFSGKRPFGNSGWEFELYIPLIKASLIKGSLDSNGYVEDCDNKSADELIFSAIDALGARQTPEPRP